MMNIFYRLTMKCENIIEITMLKPHSIPLLLVHVDPASLGPEDGLQPPISTLGQSRHF